MLHTETVVVLRSTDKWCDYIIPAELDRFTNFRAQKARGNLRRDKGAKEIKRAFEKTDGRREKRYGAILFRNVTDRNLIIVERAAS